MDWLHGILNLIGLLFWVLWRAGTLLRPKPSNALAGPTPRPGKIFKHSWVYLIGLIVLLTLRAVFYNQFGPGLNWTPSMELVHEAPQGDQAAGEFELHSDNLLQGRRTLPKGRCRQERRAVQLSVGAEQGHTEETAVSCFR